MVFAFDNYSDRIIANAGRVTITGILSEKVSPEMARGFYHEVEGWVVFMIAGLLLALTTCY